MPLEGGATAGNASTVPSVVIEESLKIVGLETGVVAEVERGRGGTTEGLRDLWRDWYMRVPVLFASTGIRFGRAKVVVGILFTLILSTVSRTSFSSLSSSPNVIFGSGWMSPNV